MASIVSSIAPLLLTAAIIAVMMLLTMGVGWVSGKVIRKMLRIGGK